MEAVNATTSIAPEKDADSSTVEKEVSSNTASTTNRTSAGER